MPSKGAQCYRNSVQCLQEIAHFKQTSCSVLFSCLFFLSAGEGGGCGEEGVLFPRLELKLVVFASAKLSCKIAKLIFVRDAPFPKLQNFTSEGRLVYCTSTWCRFCRGLLLEICHSPRFQRFILLRSDFFKPGSCFDWWRHKYESRVNDNIDNEYWETCQT